MTTNMMIGFVSVNLKPHEVCSELLAAESTETSKLPHSEARHLAWKGKLQDFEALIDQQDLNDRTETVAST